MTRGHSINTATVACLCLLLGSTVAAARLHAKTAQAFDAYVKAAEQQMVSGISDPDFVWLLDGETSRGRLTNGEILIRPADKAKVPDGLLHDWTGTMFVKGVSVDDVVATLLDFDRHHAVYPEVTESRILETNGGVSHTYLRIKRKKIVTVVYNTEHNLQPFRPTEDRWYSISRSTKIAQVDNAGEQGEKELPVGDDSGYLWRLNAYWRLEAGAGGTFVSLRAISLSRGIPFGLGWLVKPFVKGLPRESLMATLEGTREAVLDPSYTAPAQ